MRIKIIGLFTVVESNDFRNTMNNFHNTVPQIISCLKKGEYYYAFLTSGFSVDMFTSLWLKDHGQSFSLSCFIKKKKKKIPVPFTVQFLIMEVFIKHPSIYPL